MSATDRGDGRPLSESLPGTWQLISRVDVDDAGQVVEEPTLGSDPKPLISAGNYYEFKSLAKPKSYDFTEYDYLGTPYPGTSVLPGNPDFNFKSLRGNAVFRWEYRPGSALYLVWTQERSDADNTGEFNMNANATQLLKADANNVFLAKVTYYFGL